MNMTANPVANINAASHSSSNNKSNGSNSNSNHQSNMNAMNINMTTMNMSSTTSRIMALSNNPNQTNKIINSSNVDTTTNNPGTKENDISPSNINPPRSNVHDRDAWNRGGRQFSSPREVYTRSLYRLCLKFTTSEDEDEGKPEPATAYWTVYGRTTTLGNGESSGPSPDDICRRMDDSMTGPKAGILARLTDFDGEVAALHALRAGMTTGWNVRGDRGDVAIRVGRGRILNISIPNTINNKLSNSSNSITNIPPPPEEPSIRRDAKLLSLNAERWVLCKGASFAAGNSVFNIEDINDVKEKLTMHCAKGPMRGKIVEVYASSCPWVFGRAHEADMCIMDRELSRKHGAILYFKHTHGSTKESDISSPTPLTNPKMVGDRVMDRERDRERGIISKGAVANMVKSAGVHDTGFFVLCDLESTNGSYMRLVGPYSHKGMGALSLGDEFIVGRTGFSVNRFDYGISEAIGARPTMEDRSVVIQSLMYAPPRNYYTDEPKETLNELAMTTFAAIFDGHGGDECSNFLVDALPKSLRKMMYAEKDSLRGSVESTRNYRSGQSEQTEDNVSELMRHIIKTAYLETDKEFITPKSAPQSGSTAATIILIGRRLFAANVGDSRVVLCRAGGQCVELTSDHKPTRPDEAARVRAAGGFILHKRVMGELAITRAFGDKSFKLGIKAMLEEEDNRDGTNSMIGSGTDSDADIKDLTAPLVSPEPEIASMVISHHDEFLLLACDGLFDVFRSQDAIALARQELINLRGDPAEVARIISDQAIRVRRSRDNVSILIIVLRPFWET